MMATPMKSHLVTLSFDDGFAKSFARTAAIYEEFGMKACLNVIAAISSKEVGSPNTWRNCPVGGLELWNELAGRGHEIMPHGWDHSNLSGIPFADACRDIDRCLEAFRNNLKGFLQEKAVFNFPYNASTPAVETYLELKVRVRGYRTGPGGAVNRWPSPETRRITVSAFGPGNCEEHLDHELGDFLSGGPGASEAGEAQQGRPAVATVAPGWFVYNLHGLDEEGWGPITADYLRRLLERLGSMGHVEVIPAAVALGKYGSRQAQSPS